MALTTALTVGAAVLGAIIASYISVQPSDPRAQSQFLDGFHAALWVAAAIAFTGAIVAVATVRKVEHPELHAVPEAA